MALHLALRPRRAFAIPLLAVHVLAAGACREVRAPNAAAVDSAAADAAALASLPPALTEALEVQQVLGDSAIGDTSRVRCERMPALDSTEVRRRLRARSADGATSVLFVRAAAVGPLRRVELVRADSAGGQRGFIWDVQDDVVRSVVWPWAGAPHAEVTALPHGGPLPRALRALGRRLLARPCTATTPR